MGNVEAGKAANIDLKHKIGRIITATVLSPVLRSETTDTNGSIEKAKDVLKRGQGLMIIINHFSGKDPIQAIREVFRYPVMNDKKVIAPIAVHTDNPMVHFVGKITDTAPKPIVTQKTIDAGKNNGRPLNDGMKEYLEDSINLLKKGGIVVLAPQGTRMPHLGQPNSPTIGTLMAAAKRNKLENFAFLFIGFGMKDVDDYSKKTKLNPRDRYTVNIGSLLMSEEILARAEGKFKNVDAVIYDELRKAVPENYK